MISAVEPFRTVVSESVGAPSNRPGDFRSQNFKISKFPTRSRVHFRRGPSLSPSLSRWRFSTRREASSIPRVSDRSIYRFAPTVQVQARHTSPTIVSILYMCMLNIICLGTRFSRKRARNCRKMTSSATRSQAPDSDLYIFNIPI